MKKTIISTALILMVSLTFLASVNALPDKGLSKEINKGNTFVYQVDSKTTSVRLNNVGMEDGKEYARLYIRSRYFPTGQITQAFSGLETKQIDLDLDNIKDLEISLTSITGSSKATFTFRELATPAFQQATQEFQTEIVAQPSIVVSGNPILLTPTQLSGIDVAVTPVIAEETIISQAAVEQVVITPAILNPSKKSISRKINTGNVVFFKIDSTTTNLRLNNARYDLDGESFVNLEIRSRYFETPERAKLLLGETKNFDLNLDGKNDLALTLDSLRNSASAVIRFTEL